MTSPLALELAQQGFVDQLRLFQERAAAVGGDMATLRAMFEVTARAWNDDVSPGGVLTSDTSYTGAFGETWLRVYRPAAAAAALPVIVYLHGGGWIFGSPATADGYARSLCKASGSAVVSVDYRLAPEHRFPVPIDHCIESVRWTAANAGALGIDRSRIALAGDSAGANLALAAAAALRDELPLRALVLICPALAPDVEHPSRTAYCLPELAQRPGGIDAIWDHYLGSRDLRANPRANPLRGTLDGLPPTLVQAAGYDIFLGDSRAGACALIAAGTACTYTEYPRSVHGFTALVGRSPTADAALMEAGDFLNSRLSAAGR